MAVLIECTTVVIVKSSLERRFPGGLVGFEKHAPNATSHSDGKLVAVSFMVPQDAQVFIGTLAEYGFANPWNSRSEDIVIVDPSAGLLTPCDWLKADLRLLNGPDGKPFAVTLAWLGDEEPTTFAAPQGWRPGQIEQISPQEVNEKYDLVKTDRHASGAAVLAYRHRETGRVLYIARTAAGVLDLQERYRSIRQDLAKLMETPDSRERAEALAHVYDRATRVTEETEGESGPFLMQGIAARLANRWTEAERAFRKVTELSPEQIEGWLELTWTLSSLGRLDEAETAARRAVELQDTNAAAHGNLATTLLQQDKPEEALSAIERALELDPSDAMNVKILQQVRQALNAQAAERRAALPWHKRWFR